MPATVPVLTVDLGNTSCALRQHSGDEVRALPSVDPRSPTLGADLAGVLAGLPADGVAALSSVAAPEVQSVVEAALAAYFGEHFLAGLDADLEIVCRDPHTIGSDRLFAARGAAQSLGGSTLVIDAGTALTVDAVEVPPAESQPVPPRPRFHGGAIAPGPQLLAEALARAARLHAVTPEPGVPALGLDTPAALRAGVTVGFRGAALELVLRIGEESGLGHGSLALCGGARDFLLEPPLFPGDARVHVLPDLVHGGLAAAARTHLAAAGDAGADGSDRAR